MERSDWQSPDLLEFYPTKVNVEDGVFSGNIEAACKLDLPWLQIAEAHDRQAVLVGGGPSLPKFIEEIRAREAEGQTIVALNNAASYLLEHDILPDAHILMDAKPSTARFVCKGQGILYYIASQCAPQVFAEAEHVTVWHPNTPEIKACIGDRETVMVGGGTTVGMCALSILFGLGYRTMHLYGMDSCYLEGEGHAYPQVENDADAPCEFYIRGQRFLAAGWMAHQADEFKNVLCELVNAGCTVTIAGNGMLAAIAKSFMTPRPEAITAVYDLAVSPPTYDYVSFLMAAEQERRKQDADFIDIVIQPGPRNGFRDDNLPPNDEEREKMLHNIVIPMSQLVPSVRGLSVVNKRYPIKADWPKNYDVDTPTHGYGMVYTHTCRPCFKLPDSDTLSDPLPYVTITIREAPYWPTRNSNKPAWVQAAQYIERKGYKVIFVPDTNGKPIEGFDNDIPASKDVIRRFKLYAGAFVNLGASNGCLQLCMAGNLPYIMFKITTEDDSPATKAEFLEKHGISWGENFSRSGKCVWKDDSADVIIEAFNKFIADGEQHGCSG